jgi:sugar O-acyltransferase (sialic acid O-acetyltransferase NeuD family)
MKRMSIVLLGGGGHCRSCIDVIEQEGKYKIAGIVDRREKAGEMVLGYTIFATDDELEKLSRSFDRFLITVGQIKTAIPRQNLHRQCERLNLKLPTIVSPGSYVSKHATVGEGTIVMHHAVVNAGARIGRNCIINTKALVEHDAVIEDHCHISTCAVVNGGVTVGEGTFIGSGAVTKQQINIPQNSYVKANSIVQ